MATQMTTAALSIESAILGYVAEESAHQSGEYVISRVFTLPAGVSPAFAARIEIAIAVEDALDAAIATEKFSASEVLASFQGVAMEEIEGEITDGSEGL